MHIPRGETFVAIALSVGLCGCSSSAVAPAAPSAAPAAASPNPTSLVVFSDGRGFSTTDLFDAHNRIIQFTSGSDLIWTADGTHLPGYFVDPNSARQGDPSTYFIGLPGNRCDVFCVFSVRFGSVDGQRRAYLTIDYGHSNPGTLVDVEVVNRTLVVTQTTSFPPGTPTLSGIVTEMTTAGPVPVAGVLVSRGVPAGWQAGTSDPNGFYKISGLIEGTALVQIDKAGYRSQSTQLPLTGDARFDVQLVRNQ